MSEKSNKYIKIKCHGCKKEYSINSDKIPGKATEATCKNCGQKIVLPSSTKITHVSNNDSNFSIPSLTSNQKRMTCPRCYKEQPASPECVYCGIVLFKHYKKKEENLNNEKKSDANKKDKRQRKTDEPSVPEEKLSKHIRTGILNKLNPKITAIGASIACVTILIIVIGFIFDFGKMSTEDLVLKTEGSVALIRHDQGSGSGFMIDNNILATNYHVVEGVFPEDLEIYFPSVSRDPIQVDKVVYFDESRDVALIAIKCNISPLPISSKASLKHGEDLVIIGNPGISNKMILKNSVTRGSLNSETIIDGQKYLQISASMNPGNSGGPAFNYDGKVVAIITLKATRQEGITFGLPMDDLVPIIKKVNKSSEEDRSRGNSHFLVNSLFKRLSKYIGVNLYAMGLYIDGMNMALDRYLPASEGLSIVKDKIDQTVSNANKFISPDKINKNLKRVYQCEFIDADVKKGLIELWECAKNIRQHVDYPRGNVKTYTKDWKRLSDKFENISDILKIKLNIKEV